MVSAASERGVIMAEDREAPALWGHPAARTLGTEEPPGMEWAIFINWNKWHKEQELGLGDGRRYL